MGESPSSVGMDLALQAVDLLLEQAQKHVARIRRAMPVVRIVKVAAEDADLAIEQFVPIHKCGERCGAIACEITDAQLRQGYHQAVNRLRNVQYLMGRPLDDGDDDDAPTYDELVARYRERGGVAT